MFCFYQNFSWKCILTKHGNELRSGRLNKKGITDGRSRQWFREVKIIKIIQMNEYRIYSLYRNCDFSFFFFIQITSFHCFFCFHMCEEYSNFQLVKCFPFSDFYFSLDEINEHYRIIEPLHSKLKELKDENSRFCQVSFCMSYLWNSWRLVI